MTSQSLPEILHLKQGEELLAVLKKCEPVEMFWLGCNFEPTAAFSNVEWLFRQATEALENNSGATEVFDECYAKLKALDVVLVDVEGNRTSRNFIMHIRENSVDVRFSFEQ